MTSYKCSSDEQQHRRRVQNNSRSKARMPSLTHPLQHLSWVIMTDALEEHDGKVGTSGRNITHLWFAIDTDALAEEKQELEALVKASTKPAQGI